MRLEADAFGDVEIPADRLWGAQTQRAIATFGAGEPRLPIALLRAFGLQKSAAARANAVLGALDEERAALIVRAAGELAAGAFDDHFPLPVWQTGSGTQTNMTANEVIANRANQLAGAPLGGKRPVHPNDHVNRSQSSNDSFPTVMHISAIIETEMHLLPALRDLAAALEDRAAAFSDLARLGRTHLNDAVPVPFSQGFSAAAVEIRRISCRMADAVADLHDLPQGGTAAGSGLNAPDGFDEAFCRHLQDATGRPFRAAAVKVEAMAGHDALVALSATCEALSVALTRLVNDIRHLSSGPNAGIGELILPDDGLTSSIMPGKRNATLGEALLQVCHHVCGNHTCLTRGAASGVFELNVSKPVIIHALLGSIAALSQSIPRFTSGCLAGIRPNKRRILENLDRSMMAATALTPHHGYDVVASLIRRAEADGLTLREAAIQDGLMKVEEFDRLVDPVRLARGGLAVVPSIINKESQ